MNRAETLSVGMGGSVGGGAQRNSGVVQGLLLYDETDGVLKEGVYLRTHHTLDRVSWLPPLPPLPPWRRVAGVLYKACTVIGS